MTLEAALHPAGPEWDMQPQTQSPLYDGTIPPEIRLEIFEHVLMPFVPDPARHDFRLHQRHDGQLDNDLTDDEQRVLQAAPGALHWPKEQVTNSADYITPGYRGKEKTDTCLLRTCRRIYLEVRDMILQSEVCFWFYRGPGRHQRDWIPHISTSMADRNHIDWHLFDYKPGLSTFFNYKITPYQANRIHNIHLFTQLFWLEDQLYSQLASLSSPLRGIKTLRITLRRGDWWGNETNGELHINPFQWRSDLEAMNEMMEGQRGEAAFSSHLSINPGNPWTKTTKAWGLAFAHLPNLKRLVIDFETSEDKKSELERIVGWAVRDWKFPLRSQAGNCLSAKSSLVERKSWRGMPTHWPHLCPRCRQPLSGDGRSDWSDCSECVRTARLAGMGLGPRIFSWAVTWTASWDETYDFFPQGGLELLDKNLSPNSWAEDLEIPTSLASPSVSGTCVQSQHAYAHLNAYPPLILGIT